MYNFITIIELILFHTSCLNMIKSQVYQVQKYGTGWKVMEYMEANNYSITFHGTMSYTVKSTTLKTLVENSDLPTYTFIFECDLTAPSTIFQVIMTFKDADEKKRKVNYLLSLNNKGTIEGTIYSSISWADEIPQDIYDKMEQM
jgi:hypothetical protein